MTRRPPKFQAYEVYSTLEQHWGSQSWWPADSLFEVIVGAILTQNTAWSNVERAIANLAEHEALQPAAIDSMAETELAKLIVPAGYYNLKARRLKNFVELLVRKYDCEIDRLFQLETGTLRSVLLSVNGIGPETADSILLYAADRPVFVVDAYTRRFMERHGWLAGDEKYDAIAEFFTGQLPRDVAIFNQFHALIVRLGKACCRRRPHCGVCPLGIYPLKKGLQF